MKVNIACVVLAASPHRDVVVDREESSLVLKLIFLNSRL